jgi:hypothetical protein
MTRTKEKKKATCTTAEETMQQLSKIAFANVLDFARFEPNGRVHIFDWDKARDIGAKVSVVTRKVGRGKSAREVRTTSIKMPNKFPALMKLLKIFDRIQGFKTAKSTR